MGMPVGFKSERGYATVSNIGMGYREIAEEMCDLGFKMNHSTARNVFLATMRKFAKEICHLYGIDANGDSVSKIASDPRFQSGLYDIISSVEK